jgi:hypothetical protein
MTWLSSVLAAAPVGDEARRTLMAIAERRLVPVRAELRLFFWIAIALVTGGVGAFLARNVDRIGHAAIIVGLAAIAGAGYFVAWRMGGRGKAEGRRQKAEVGAKAKEGVREVAPAADAILLLSALILSADVGYLEAQYRVFGHAWHWHLLILAVFHAVTAYVSGSEKVLALAVTSLAAFFGVDRTGRIFEGGLADAAARLTLSAAVVATWRIVHGWAVSGRWRDHRILSSFVGAHGSRGGQHSGAPPQDDGDRLPLSPSATGPAQPVPTEWGVGVLEQAAFHLAMIGALVASFDHDLELVGLAALAFLAILGVIHAVRSQSVSYLVFAVIYLTIGIDAFVARKINEEVLLYTWFSLTTPLAIVALFLVTRRFRERFS